MRFNEEKAMLKPGRDFAILHIVRFYAVHMEFLSQLSSVFGTGADGLKSACVCSASMVRPRCAAGTGRTTG